MRCQTRRAGLDDLDALATLFDRYRQFYQYPSDLALSRHYLQQRLQSDESIIFIAENEAGIGLCQLYPTFCSLDAAPILTLYDLFVDPEIRGSGAGKALMLAAQQYATDSGVSRMDLSTADDNLQAQGLYESLGWQADEIYRQYSWVPGRG